MDFGIGYNGLYFDGSNGFRQIAHREELMDKDIKKLHTLYENSDLRVDSYSLLYMDTGVLDHWIQITNISDRDIVIDRVDTLKRDIAGHDYYLHYFTSGWGKEFSLNSKSLKDDFILENRKGRSSAEIHPWVMLKNSNSHIISISIAWSGNWIMRFNKTHEGFSITGGLSDWEFYKKLKPGQQMEGIHVITVENHEGDTDSIANSYIRWGRKYWYPTNHISQSITAEWNHWWPYEDLDIDEQTFKQNVDKAYELGLELCTLDAGWFGLADESTDWYKLRGDWDKANTKRFPSGIRALSDYVHEKGLKFGLWCEIEGLGIDADLRMSHPEFEARHNGEYIGYVCFGNPDAQEWAFQTLDRIISEYNCDWIKLDFNLDPNAGCNRTDHGHGAGDGLYEHYMGYYKVLDRIRAKHPQVILENCSSGGLRIDLGLMKHTHCVFLSDPDTPVHDLQLYWGAMTVLAPNVCLHWPWSHSRVNAHGHVPFPPLDLTKPGIPMYKLDYYIRISMLGWFGCSHKLPEIPGHIFNRLKDHIDFYKATVKPYLLKGDVYKLTGQALRDGGGDRWNAFQYAMPDKQNNLVFVFRLSQSSDSKVIRLKGLDPEKTYSLYDVDLDITIDIKGSDAMDTGIQISGLHEEDSRVFLIKPKGA